MPYSMLRAILKQGSGATFTAVVSFLLLAWLARILGTTGFGEYAAVLSLALLGLIAIEGGWPTFLYREEVGSDAHGKAGVLVRHAVAHVTITSLLLAALSILAGKTLGAALGPALLCMGCVALANLVSARLRARGSFGTEAVWQGAARLISATSIVLACSLFVADASVVFTAWAGGLLLVTAIWGRRWLAWPTWQGITNSYRRVLPFVVSAGFLAFLLRADMAILAAAGLERESLSYYAACTRFTEAAILMFAPVTNVVLRNLRLAVDASERFERLWSSAVGLALAAGLAAVAGAWSFGPPLVSVVFGEAYRPAGTLLPYVAAALPFLASNLVLAQALIAQGREHELARLLGVCCALLVVALWLGVRWDGARGAALGAVAVHALLVVLAGRAAKRNRREPACVSP